MAIPMTRVRGSLIIAAVALLAARPAEAWNPLKPIGAAAKWVGRALGGVAGSFAESATGPAIRNVEVSGHRLIGDVEGALDRQLGHAGGVASKLVGEVDKSVGERLAQVDHSLEARILQARIAADEGVDHALGRLDQSIGRVDEIARKRIDQIGKLGKDLIGRVDDAAGKLLAQADGILERRADDLRQIVRTSIQEADDVAAARIEQLDEAAGRRIGSVDVIATKQSLGLEGMLLRLAAIVGMVAFLAFVLWRLFVEAGTAWTKALAERGPRRVLATLIHGAPRFLVQVGLGVAGIAALYFLSGYLPRDARARAERQIAEHEGALDAAFVAYDFTSVRYHSTQLELLKADGAPRYRALARKAELLRTALARPAILSSSAGVRQIAAEIDAVERALADPDPDVLTLKAFVTWRVGATRRDEYEAAALCAQALRLGGAAPGGFMLQVLARNYLRAFLHDPYPADGGVTAADLARLREALPGAPEAAESQQFQHLIAYNDLVARLDLQSSAAYLDLLDAHADYLLARGAGKGARETEAARAARERRTKHAEQVVEAWRAFDAALAGSPWLVDDPTALSAFTLDDAVLSHALYFIVVPEAAELPPPLSAEPGAAQGSKLPELVRVKIAPIRIAWARRYAALVGPKASELLAIEEARRFEGFERRAAAFERAYVALAVALRKGSRPDAGELAAASAPAIRAAAEIGLYRETPEGRRGMASILAALVRQAGGPVPAELEQLIADGQQQRRLRFL